MTQITKLLLILLFSLPLCAQHRAYSRKTPIQGNAKSGKITFRDCEGCHASTTDETLMGPSLKGLFSRPKLVNGQRTSEAAVREVLVKGYKSMPPVSYSGEKLQDLLAYLSTL